MSILRTSGKLEALRAGQHWWPAEIVLRGLGLLSLAGFGRLAAIVHRMAITPALHSPGLGELALCAGLVILLCGGLTLTCVGPGLFRRVPLPPHFTRYTDYTP